ncbi:hypothetical protein PR048_028400 [Dryococelus australis]|uniref:Guanylate kinase-like domain-containing protein n=1 Tax=Dryococelus australis TaxID=614101 RepID=A0ABQ9GAE8_9NEOP|nr:hypothetical protein PR048_028400 [Dryococelus australis]
MIRPLQCVFPLEIDMGPAETEDNKGGVTQVPDSLNCPAAVTSDELHHTRCGRLIKIPEDELKDIIEKAREMEEKYGHYFDMIIINNDTDRAFHQLVSEINSLEREPQWVPAQWVRPV